MLDITSAPTTSAQSWCPVATSSHAVDSEKVNAEHPALRSNPHARGAPIFLWTRQAVLGNM